MPSRARQRSNTNSASRVHELIGTAHELASFLVRKPVRSRSSSWNLRFANRLIPRPAPYTERRPGVSRSLLGSIQGSYMRVIRLFLAHRGAMHWARDSPRQQEDLCCGACGRARARLPISVCTRCVRVCVLVCVREIECEIKQERVCVSARTPSFVRNGRSVAGVSLVCC